MSQEVRRKATVRDVAAETGLSIATVSRVLNDAVNVSPQARQTVRAAVERLGENAPAPRTRPGSVAEGAVYVRCPYVLTDYFGLIVSSIAETLELHGRRMVLNAGEASQGADIVSRLPTTAGITGGLLILPPEPSDELVRLRSRGFPFVVVDPRTPLPRDIAAVSAAHFSGARSMSSHLVELGHRRIGVIAGPDDWVASDARRAGHAAALADAGVLSSPELTRSVEPTTGWGYHAACELLDLPERPTALVAFNDKAAVGALQAAEERGLTVPGDLSIGGFDDIDLATATRPTLTTVRQPLQEMGRMAVTQLIRMVDQHTVETLHLELATELVVRGSTGPVRPSRND